MNKKETEEKEQQLFIKNWRLIAIWGGACMFAAWYTDVGGIAALIWYIGYYGIMKTSPWKRN